MRSNVTRVLGVAGLVAFLFVFIRTPSFPTPDKLLLLATLIFMIVGQGTELLKRFVPFVGLLLIYESFRGLVPFLNSHVNYGFMPAADKFLFFGKLPTDTLQRWWWNGQVQWYDYVFYLPYVLHFVLPFTLAIIIWKKFDRHYWQYITAFVILSFAGFLTYLAFPAAPPWMAVEKGVIEPIVRISSPVYAGLGIENFPSLYSKISPNPVAAVPSLHAAYAALFAMYVVKLFKAKWRYLAWIHPVLIWVGTVYQGEHYAIDAILGVIYAVAAYYVAPFVLAKIRLSRTLLRAKLLTRIATKAR